MSFHNQVVFITGASSGIGAALAQQFSKEGAKVVLLARRVERLQQIVSGLGNSGREALAIQGDVTRDGDLEKAVQNAVQKFGKIDIVIANAGFGVVGNVENLKLEDYRRQFETNVFGVLRTFYAAASALKKSRGSFVIIGSAAGYVSAPGSSPYSMSKFAVHALARSLRVEMKPYGVSVTLIVPGFVDSEIRNVDNQGHFQPKAAALPVSGLIMPTDQAAKQILSAIRAKRAEQIITLHGKIAVWIQRHLPWIYSILWDHVQMRGRQEPQK